MTAPEPSDGLKRYCMPGPQDQLAPRLVTPWPQLVKLCPCVGVMEPGFLHLSVAFAGEHAMARLVALSTNMEALGTPLWITMCLSWATRFQIVTVTHPKVVRHQCRVLGNDCEAAPWPSWAPGAGSLPLPSKTGEADASRLLCINSLNAFSTGTAPVSSGLRCKSLSATDNHSS